MDVFRWNQDHDDSNMLRIKIPHLNHVMALSCEAMCEQPRETGAGIEAFLGLKQPFPDSTYERSFPTHNMQGEPSRLSNFNQKSHARLSAEAIESITKVVEPVLGEFGYDRLERPADGSSRAGTGCSVARPGAAHHHALVEQGQSAASGPGDVDEPGSFEEPPERGRAPELDVPAIPEGIRVLVELSRERDQEVLQIPVVGGGPDEDPAWLQRIEAGRRPLARRVEVLHDLGGHDNVKGFLLEFLQEVGPDHGFHEPDIRIGLSCCCDSGFGGLDPHDRAALLLEPACQRAIARTDIEDADPLTERSSQGPDGRQVVRHMMNELSILEFMFIYIRHDL